MGLNYNFCSGSWCQVEKPFGILHICAVRTNMGSGYHVHVFCSFSVLGMVFFILSLDFHACYFRNCLLRIQLIIFNMLQASSGKGLFFSLISPHTTNSRDIPSRLHLHDPLTWPWVLLFLYAWALASGPRFTMARFLEYSLLVSRPSSLYPHQPFLPTYWPTSYLTRNQDDIPLALSQLQEHLWFPGGEQAWDYLGVQSLQVNADALAIASRSEERGFL